jgi:hypothetical protein
VNADDEQQRAADEATFREANERIREVQAELELSRRLVAFLCECDDRSCREPILLSADEYERVRSDGTCFVIVAGHSTFGEIVEESEGHAIVRKTGLGGLIGKVNELSQETDPRS